MVSLRVLKYNSTTPCKISLQSGAAVQVGQEGGRGHREPQLEDCRRPLQPPLRGVPSRRLKIDDSEN